MNNNKFWQSSIPIGYYDHILEKGLIDKKGIQSNWHNTTFKKIKSHIPTDVVHLDYACGPGTFIGLYVQARSTGVDISDEQINFARKKYSKNGEFVDYKNFDVNKFSGHFDVITVIGLLEFLDDNSNIKILDDLYAMLKPGGKLVMTTPNFKSIMPVLIALINKFSKVSYQDQHINKLNKNTVEKLLNKSDFKNGKIKVKKFINFGLFLSFINWNIGSAADKLISNIFFNFFGYLLLVTAIKSHDKQI